MGSVASSLLSWYYQPNIPIRPISSLQPNSDDFKLFCDDLAKEGYSVIGFEVIVLFLKVIIDRANLKTFQEGVNIKKQQIPGTGETNMKVSNPVSLCALQMSTKLEFTKYF